jgi:hypothetical protein
LVWKPRVCPAHPVPVDGRRPGGPPQLCPQTTPNPSAPLKPSPARSRESSVSASS